LDQTGDVIAQLANPKPGVHDARFFVATEPVAGERHSFSPHGGARMVAPLSTIGVFSQMAAFHVTDTSFDAEVLAADVPVVVDFTASWCPPCHAIAPFLDEIADELVGRVKIAKLDVDENPDITVRYGVRSMPTLIVFKNGEPTAMQIGAVPKNRLSDWIKRAI
jgi:thioredoxin 1